MTPAKRPRRKSSASKETNARTGARSTGDAHLSRRERQIMDVVYRLGSASVTEIAALIPDAPTAGAMRTMLRILETKKLLVRSFENTRLIYTPAIPRDQASSSVLSQVIRTFFNGSAARAMSRLLDTVSATELSEQDVDRLARLVSQARERQKGDRK